MVEFAVIPRRLALLNIDMQNWFVDASPRAEPDPLRLIARLNRLAAACRAAGATVVHIRHVLRADGSNTGVLGEIAPAVRRGVIAPDAQSAALHPLVRVEAGDILLDKPRFGAFHATDLELILRTRGVESVIIAGMATSVCCETTAREATMRDLRVFFLSDGTANAGAGDLTPREVNRATCATIARVFGAVLDIDAMIERIAAAGRV